MSALSGKADIPDKALRRPLLTQSGRDVEIRYCLPVKKSNYRGRVE